MNEIFSANGECIMSANCDSTFSVVQGSSSQGKCHLFAVRACSYLGTLLYL